MPVDVSLTQEEDAFDEAGPLDAMQMDADTPIRDIVMRWKAVERVPPLLIVLANSFSRYLRENGCEAFDRVAYGKSGGNWGLLVYIRPTWAHKHPSLWAIPPSYGGAPVFFAQSARRDGEP